MVGWAVGAALLATPLAAAADDGETALSVGLAYASFAIPDREPAGAALGFDYERGVADEIWFRASLQAAGYAPDGGPSFGGQGTLGLTYIIDVIKYVPYLHAGVGAAAIGGGELDNQLHPLAEIGAGLDKLARRGLSYGVFARVGSFLDDSAFTTVGARATWRYGFF